MRLAMYFQGGLAGGTVFDDIDKGLSRPQPQQDVGFDDSGKGD